MGHLMENQLENLPCMNKSNLNQINCHNHKYLYTIKTCIQRKLVMRVVIKFEAFFHAYVPGTLSTFNHMYHPFPGSV